MPDDLRQTNRNSGRRRNLDSLARQWRRARLMKVVFAASVAALAATVGLMVWLLVWRQPPEESPTAPTAWSWSQVLRSQRLAGEAMADFIREHYPEAAVLAVASAAADAERDDSIEGATLQGLLAGLREHRGQVEVALVELDDPSGDLALPLGFRAGAFDRATEAFPEVDVVVSVIGLPLRPERMEFWRRRPRPRLLLVNAEIFRLAKLIAAGGIDAVAVRDPAFFRPRPETEAGERDLRELWLLVTPGNVAEVRRRHPNLFIGEDDDDDDEAVELPELTAPSAP